MIKMTEKRFQYNVNKNTIEQDGKFVAYMNSVDGVRIANKLNVFQKENEQLKKDCSNLIDDNTEYVSEMNHIKQVIKEAYNNERTQIGKNTLKQLMEAIQWVMTEKTFTMNVNHTVIT